MENMENKKPMETKIVDLMSIEDSIKLFESLKTPPNDVLKPIEAGRMKGFTEINPLWRMKAMTDKFGLYGEGWKYEVVERWKEPVEATKEVMVFIAIQLYTRNRNTLEWNAPSYAIGSSYLIVKDKNGIHGNENAYASAETDAFGKACKVFGIGYDVYLNKKGNGNNQGRPQGNNYPNQYQNRNNYNNQRPQQNNRPNQPVQGQQKATNVNDETANSKGNLLKEIQQEMLKLNIPQNGIKEIIKEHFHKENSKEMTLEEITVLKSNLQNLWQKTAGRLQSQANMENKPA